MTKRIRLADVLVAFETGKRPRGGAVEYGVPSLGGEHVTREGHLMLNPMRYVPKAYFAHMTTGKIAIGDVLVVKDGATTGRVGIVEEQFPLSEAGINEHLFLLRANRKLLDPRYLYFYLRSEPGQLQVMSDFRGAAQGGITRGIGDKVQVPLPAIEEQRRLVDVLSRAESIVRMRREAEARAKEIIPALFLDMFGDPARNERGWDTVQLDTLIRETKLGMVRGSKDLSNEFRLPYLRMDSVSDGTIIAKRLKRTDASPAEEEAYALAIGDLLFNTRNSRELVGKAALVRHLPEPVTLFNNNLMRVRFHEARASPEFVADQFQTRFVQDQLESIKRGTTSVFAIYFKDLKTVKLRLPPIQAQRDFARRCDRLYELREPQRQATELAGSTFQSLLAGVFREDGQQ